MIYLGTLAVYPFRGSILGGDIIRLSGPCFDSETNEISCKFGDLEVAGELESNNIARCITPTFFSTGRISLDLSLDGGIAYNFQGLFTLVSIDQISSKVTRTNPGMWIFANQYSITWDTDIFENIVQNVDIEVIGYSEDVDTPSLNTIYKVNDGSEVEYSSGTYSFSELDDTADLSEYRVGFIKVSQAFSTSDVPPTIWSDIHSLQWLFDFSSSTCNTWYNNEVNSLGLVFLGDTPSCPCTLTQALVDVGRFGPHPDCNQDDASDCDGRAGAIHCVRALQPSDSGGGQECCYSEDEDILNVDTSDGGGFAYRNHNSGVSPYEAPGKVPYLSHFLNDIEPWMQCCVFTNSHSTCDKYRDVRPSQTCDGYEPPQPAGGGGDPHILTLDRRSYTFNGKGEYVMLNADPDPNSLDDNFILQARTDTLPNTLALVTAFVAVAAQLGTSAIIHVEVNERRVLDVWVKEGEQDWRWLDFEESAWWSLNGVSISGRNIAERGVLVIFTGGVSLELKASNGVMSILFLGPESFKDNTKGLLGTWNDNPDDDFLSPTGETISPNATLEEIHNQFGQQWQISAAESLFYYPQGMTADDFKDESFTPVFDFPMNPGLTEEEVATTCGGNEWCLFDFHATGNMEIATASRAAYEEQTAVIEASANVIICSSLENPPNGIVVVTRSSVGGVAMYSCADNYVIMGLDQRVCQEDGTWFGNAPSCSEVIPIGPSSFMMKMSAYTVLESDRSVDVTITRTGDISTDGRIRLVTAYTESASFSTDYNPIDVMIGFSPDVEEIEYPIGIKNDEVREPLEYFEVHLHEPEASDLVMPDMATIFIQDDEIEYGFRESAYTVSESSESVRLNVQKIGFLERSSVNYVTLPDSAVAPEDYTHMSGSVTFEAGQMLAYIDIPIHDDTEYEEPEQFIVVLHSDTPGQVGNRDTAVVNIDSDDGLCSQPCEHEGQCIGIDTCMCSPAYFGNFCQNENCPSGCENGGTCMAFHNCKCVDGFKGDRCETPVCTPPCENGGTCSDGNICLCPPSHTNDRCQKPACSPPCLNGGVCVDVYTCRCPYGFTGGQCQIPATEDCLTLPAGICEGPKFTCVETSESYQCVCADGYYEIGENQCRLAPKIVRAQMVIDAIDGIYLAFRDEFNYPGSSEYIELASDFTNVLLENFRSSISGLLDIRVRRFLQGSVKVEFDVLIEDHSTSGSQHVLDVLQSSTDPVTLMLTGSTIRVNPFYTLVIDELCPAGFCNNDAVCVPDPVNFISTCQCKPGFGGVRCEIVEEDSAGSEKRAGLLTRDIIGIVFGTVLIPVVAGYLVLCFCWYRRKKTVTLSTSLTPNWYLGNPRPDITTTLHSVNNQHQFTLPSFYTGDGMQYQTTPQYQSWNFSSRPRTLSPFQDWNYGTMYMESWF